MRKYFISLFSRSRSYPYATRNRRPALRPYALFTKLLCKLTTSSRAQSSASARMTQTRNGMGRPPYRVKLNFNVKAIEHIFSVVTGARIHCQVRTTSFFYLVLTIIVLCAAHVYYIWQSIF